MKKLSNSVVEKYVKGKNGKILKGDYKNNKSIFQIQCEFGHIWETKWISLRTSWCIVCSRNNREKKIKRGEILKVVENFGYELITEGELTRLSRIEVKCNIHNFIWETCYGNMKYEKGKCKLCSSNSIDYKTLIDTIEEKNGTLVKRTFGDGGMKLIVKCNVHNREWRTRWSEIQRGVWCFTCSMKDSRITHEEIKSIVEEKNGTLLTKNCSTATMPIDIRCNRDNYEWTTTWHRINQKCWCPKCSKRCKYNEEEIRQIVEERGGKLLEKYTNNVSKKIKIRCGCGNDFFTTMSAIISRDVWCQLCNGRFKTQRKVYENLKEIYPDYIFYFNYRGFEWLKMRKNNKARMEIDILIHNENSSFVLAIEYDGKQHFEPVRFASAMTKEQAKKVFKDTKRRDKKKNKLITEHPDEIKYFVRFNYKDKIDKESIIKRLKQKGVPTPRR